MEPAAESSMIIRLLTAVFAAVLLPAWTLAVASLREVPLEPDIDAELNYLLSFVGPSRVAPSSFRPERIANTLAFVGNSKKPAVLYYANGRRGAPSAYFEIDVRRPLKDVLRLTYDPNVPAAVTAPSTVRTAAWKQIDPQSLAKLWDSLPKLSEPVNAIGTEHVVNTPDATTGAYYAYDLDRTLLLLLFEGKPMFISLSAQEGASEVGRQGLILGPDEQWSYLYTGRAGLNMPGLGWVDTYMYDSCSAAFYLGGAGAGEFVRVGMFKWLRAGWAGMNMVRSSHIYEGLQRYGTALKAVLEHPGTADTEKLVHKFARLQSIPTRRLRELAVTYFKNMVARLSSNADEKARSLLADPGYVARLGREDLLALLSLERLKSLLGKPHILDSTLLATLSTESR